MDNQARALLNYLTRPGFRNYDTIHRELVDHITASKPDSDIAGKILQYGHPEAIQAYMDTHGPSSIRKYSHHARNKPCLSHVLRFDRRTPEEAAQAVRLVMQFFQISNDDAVRQLTMTAAQDSNPEILAAIWDALSVKPELRDELILGHGLNSDSRSQLRKWILQQPNLGFDFDQGAWKRILGSRNEPSPFVLAIALNKKVDIRPFITGFEGNTVEAWKDRLFRSSRSMHDLMAIFARMPDILDILAMSERDVIALIAGHSKNEMKRIAKKQRRKEKRKAMAQDKKSQTEAE